MPKYLPIKVICAQCGEKLEVTIEPDCYGVVNIKVTPCGCKDSLTCAECAGQLEVGEDGCIMPCPDCTCNAGCDEETRKLMGATNAGT